MIKQIIATMLAIIFSWVIISFVLEPIKNVYILKTIEETLVKLKENDGKIMLKKSTGTYKIQKGNKVQKGKIDKREYNQ